MSPTNFPTSIDSLTDPIATNPMTSPDHAGQHANANDALVAVETAIGTTGTPVLARLASPALSGTPTAPTNATATDATTQIATDAFVQNALAAAASVATTIRSTSGAPTVLSTDIVGDLAFDATATIMYGPLAGTPVVGQLWIYAGHSTAAINSLRPNEALRYSDLLGWAFDPFIINTSGATPTAAARVQLVRIPLPGPISVTNVLVYTGASGGVTLTHSYLGLYTSAGTVIGQTADQSTAWTSNYQILTTPLVGGPFAVTPLAANDFVWAALYVGTAGTLPQFWGNGSPGNLFDTASRARQGTYAVANTATLPNITPASVVRAGGGIWLAIN